MAVLFHGDRETDRVALTFDDGPGPTSPAIAATLCDLGAAGTFFALGERVADAPETLQQIAGLGHEIGNHTFTHTRESLGPRRAMNEIRRANDAIHAATGARPRLLRVPWGRYTISVRAAARVNRMLLVGWDTDVEDWRQTSPASLERAVLGAVRGGSIVVLHDGPDRRELTLAALPGLIAGLRRLGLEPVSVTRLLG